MSSPNALIKELVAAKQLPPVLLIIAKDHVRPERLVSLLCENHKISPQDIRRISGEESSVADLHDHLLAPSLFATRSVTILEGIQKLKGYAVDKARTLFDALFAATPCINHLIIIESSLPSNHSLRTHLVERKCGIVFEELSGADLEGWISKELARNKITGTTPEIVAKLAQMSADSVDQAAHLIQRLALFLDPGEDVTQQTLDALFPELLTAHEFSLIDMVLAGKRGESLLELAQLVRMKKNVFGLIALLARNLQQLLQYHVLSAAGTASSEIARRLKLSPWILRKLEPALRRLPQKRVEEMLVQLCRADLLLKSKSLGEQVTLERLVTALTR